MDVKAPMNKYAEATGTEIDTARIVRSIDLLLGSEIEYEFRTTIVPGILDEDDIVRIGEQIDGAHSYYLQQFVPRNTLDPAMMDCPPYPPSRIKAMVELVRPYVESVRVRGI
jgi:pyruvate formate lyase activating enzyme